VYHPADFTHHPQLNSHATKIQTQIRLSHQLPRIATASGIFELASVFAVSSFSRSPSPLEAERLGQKLHERRRIRARACELIEELLRADFSARQLHSSNETLALQVFDQRMRRVVAPRRSREHLAERFEPRAKFSIVKNLLPILGTRDNRVAHLAQPVRVRMPHSDSRKTFRSGKRKIKRGRIEMSRATMTERGSRVGLVRSLVAREAEIAIDAHHRAAARPRVRDKVGADLSQPRREVRDEREHRLAHLVLVTGFILEKPVAVVVAPELLEKFKTLRREVA
jgi:hypothetical protein